MVYVMEIYTDGGCKGNGQPGAIGAAAAVFKNKHGKYSGWTRSQPSDPTPTNQRAEITAIIIALEQAPRKYEELNGYPSLEVKIYSDSKYVVDCMTKWIYKWSQNGWINSKGMPVANQDLLQEASDLDDKLREEGDVEYLWIPREENEVADRMCNKEMSN